MPTSINLQFLGSDMDIVINIKIGEDKEDSKVEVKKKPAAKKRTGGVVQFPAMPVQNNPILDMMGIKET